MLLWCNFKSFCFTSTLMFCINARLSICLHTLGFGAHQVVAKATLPLIIS